MHKCMWSHKEYYIIFVAPKKWCNQYPCEKRAWEKQGGLGYVSHFLCDKLPYFIHSDPSFQPLFCYTHYLSTRKHTCENKFLVTRSLVRCLRSPAPCFSSSSSAAVTIHDCSLLLPSNVATVYSTTSASIKLHFLCDLSAAISIWAQYIASLHP